MIIFCRLTACKSKIKQHEHFFFFGCDPRTRKYAFRIKEMAFMALRLSVACSYPKFLVRGASKTTAKSKMESLITKFDGQKPIIFVPEIFILDQQQSQIHLLEFLFKLLKEKIICGKKFAEKMLTFIRKYFNGKIFKISKSQKIIQQNM